MPVNNVYSNATFSCLPGQGVCETASAYYARIGGLKFSAAISTETLAWSDNEDTMRNEVRVLSYCIGAKLPPAECESHNVVMFPQQRFPRSYFRHMPSRNKRGANLSRPLKFIIIKSRNVAQNLNHPFSVSGKGCCKVFYPASNFKNNSLGE